MFSAIAFMLFLTIVIILGVLIIHGISHYFGSGDRIVFSAFVQSMFLFWLLLFSLYIKKTQLLSALFGTPDSIHSLVWALFFNACLIIWLVHFVAYYNTTQEKRVKICFITSIVTIIVALLLGMLVTNGAPETIKKIAQALKIIWKYGVMIIVPTAFVSVVCFRKQIKMKMKQKGTLS